MLVEATGVYAHDIWRRDARDYTRLRQSKLDVVWLGPPSVTTVQSETRDLRKIDIKAFCDDLRKADLDTFRILPEAEQNVDAMWTSWTENFFSVLYKHAPLAKRSRGTITHVHRLCPWSTPQLKQLQHRRLAAHRQLKKNPGNVHLREHFVICGRKLVDSRAAWRMTFSEDSVLNIQRTPRNSGNTLTKSQVVWNIIMRHNANWLIWPATLPLLVEDPNRPDDLLRDRQKTANSSDTGNRAPYLDEFSPVTSETVNKLPRSIDTSKTSGSDGIPGLLLKCRATVLAPSLTRIFNISIVTGTVLHLFKKATITPIYKSGNKSQAGNFRPISPLPIVSKILEKVVSTQYLNEQKFLPSEQFAYRQGHCHPCRKQRTFCTRC